MKAKNKSHLIMLSVIALTGVVMSIEVSSQMIVVTAIYISSYALAVLHERKLQQIESEEGKQSSSKSGGALVAAWERLTVIGKVVFISSVLLALVVTLRLVGVFSFSWVWILASFLFPILLISVFIFLVLIIFAIKELKKEIWS